MNNRLIHSVKVGIRAFFRSPKNRSTDSPSLYSVSLAVYYKRQSVFYESHSVQVNFGIRTFDFPLSNNTMPFTLNGKALKLAGTSRHDDFAGAGWTFSLSPSVFPCPKKKKRKEILDTMVYSLKIQR